MQSQYRTRPTEKHCPHCGTRLQETQQPVMVAEEAEPAFWRTVSRRCPNDCRYTAGEVQ